MTISSLTIFLYSNYSQLSSLMLINYRDYFKFFQQSYINFKQFLALYIYSQHLFCQIKPFKSVSAYSDFLLQYHLTVYCLLYSNSRIFYLMYGKLRYELRIKYTNGHTDFCESRFLS